MKNFVEEATQYARDVVSGKVNVCKWVRLAGERHLRNLAQKNFKYHFDENKGNRICQMIELFPHVKGRWSTRNIVLKPWQSFVLTSGFGWVDSDGWRRFKTSYCEVPRKNAKALALDTLVPTPKGFKRIEDVHPGDEVYGSDGKPYKVIAESKTFIDHDCYEIEFSTGEKVIADGGHLWLTDSRMDRDRLKGRNNKTIGPKPSVKTTKKIANTVLVRGERNHRLKTALGVQNKHRKLVIDPYTLGVWLGDGHTNAARITSADIEIFQKVEDAGYIFSKTYIQGNCQTKSLLNFLVLLREAKVLGNKHIPENYFSSSYFQRLELLKGLMDTDGTVSKVGQCSYSSISKVLIEGVVSLVASLGFKPSIIQGRAKCNGKDCGPVYRLQFFAYNDTPVFHLKRKYDKQKITPKKSTRTGFRQIVNVKKVESVPVKCISTDSSDHQFLITKSYIPTHNSTIAAGVGLYCLILDEEPGCEVYSAATSREQARYVFQLAQQMVRRSPGLMSSYGVQVGAHAISILSTASTFQPLSSDADPLEGKSSHCAIIDELHAHAKRDVFDVLDTSTGARKQPILWVITTAGTNLTGICYEQNIYIRKILEQTIVDEEYFGLIYTIDDKDDWTDPKVWEKASPNYGVSVNPEDIARKARKAMELPSAQNTFLMRHLNVWTSSENPWMEMRAWARCQNDTLTIEDFYGEPCFVALDLSTKIDIAALVLVFQREEMVYFFPTFYLPEAAIKSSSNSQYAGWVKEGFITVTEGNAIDFAYIEEDLKWARSNFSIQEVPYDPNQATYLSTRMLKEGFPMVEVPPNVRNFSEPMKELEALVYTNKIEHTGNPVMTWMVSNVIAHTDSKDNIFPRKERNENKIDGVVALIMGLGRMKLAESGPSVYETEDLLVI